MATKTVPAPGYTTTKPLLAPILLMLTELGTQDACVQLQELSIRHLGDAIVAAGIAPGEYLKPLYKSYAIPHGTYQLAELNELVAKSYLVLTYSQLERMFRSVIEHYKTANPGAASSWATKNAKGENYSPLQELQTNLPKASGAALKAYPEFALLEYYRVVRVANSHVKGSTLSRAEDDYRRITEAQRKHFKDCYLLEAPNSPSDISFDDFLLFTRSVKYFAKVINEFCA